MSSLITNFAALSAQDRDLLSPMEYRTIVEMIRGILNSYQFRKLDGVVKEFYDHVNSKDPLYADSGVNFYTKIIESAYDVYVNMTANPMSLSDFETTIAPTLGFVELFRRIVLNRYLYDQVKNVSGGVTAGDYAVYLSPDWRVSESYPNPVTLTFPQNLANEAEFIRFGWDANTTPFAAIFTADLLTPSRLDLPVIFSATSDSVVTFGSPTPIPLPIASNDLTVHLQVTGTPTSTLSLLTLQNAYDVIGISINTDRLVTVSLNGVRQLGGSVKSDDGKIAVIIDKQGYLSLQVTNQMSQLRSRVSFFFNNSAPLTSLSLTGPYRTQFGTGFGLRSVTIYEGWEDIYPIDNIVVPLGYALLIDENGQYLCDPDGMPLMDVNMDEGDDELGDFTYLVDADGSYLMDENGYFYVTESETYYVIVDDDGTPLLDDDGALITEPYRTQ
jgi:hypothetical protein